MRKPVQIPRLSRWAGPCLVAAAYIAIFVASGELRFDIRRDERFFWPIIRQFADHWPPSLDRLRDYDAPTTPMAFILFGAVEHFTHGGIVLARLLNLAISLLIAWTIAKPRSGSSSQPTLAIVGLLLCPYFLGASIHIYTDILAASLGLLAAAAFTHRRHFLAALAGALAISTRQYMVAVPLACAAACLLDRASLRPRIHNLQTASLYLLASLTLLGWFALFGGTAPPTARITHLAADAPGAWHPDHASYFLACIGAYFVIPDSILFRDSTRWRRLPIRPALIAALATLLLFLLWPPRGNDPRTSTETMGYLDIALRSFLPDTLRIAALALLCLAALLRFISSPFELALLLIQALTLLKSHIAWDKYALPLLVILWYLRASHPRTQPAPVSPRPMPAAPPKTAHA